MPECTYFSDIFCHNCGWCVCETRVGNEGIVVDNSACPLHSPSSSHGKHELAETLWGTFDLGGES